MSSQRCAYFSITLELIQFQSDDDRSQRQPLRVPNYGCAIAASMIERLKSDEEGRAIAQILVMTAHDGVEHSIFGPDLEALSPSACTQDRCAQYCQAGFSNLMESYHLASTLPVEE